MSDKTKSRGVGALLTAACVVIAGFMYILRDDDVTDRRAVHFSATWNDKRTGFIEYGRVNARQPTQAKGPTWDDDMFAAPGDHVRLRVSFHTLDGPSVFRCWITVNDTVYASNDPGQKQSDNNGSCQVDAVVE